MEGGQGGGEFVDRQLRDEAGEMPGLHRFVLKNELIISGGRFFM